MPSAPITIGEYTDVPAPDSPIASAWAQETTRRTVHRFATVAARDAAYAAAAAGSGAMCEVDAVLYISNGGTWVPLAPQSAVDALTANTRSMGCQAVGPTGTTTGPVTANLQFTGVTVDTDGLYSASHPAYVQLPATGIWAATIVITLNAGYNLFGAVDLVINSSIICSFGSKFNTGSASASIVRYFGAGTTIGARFFIDSGTVTWTGTQLDVWRVS